MKLTERMKKRMKKLIFCCHCQKDVKLKPIMFTGEYYKGQEVWFAVCSECGRPFSLKPFGPPIILV